jgi:hypothetical protein
MGATKSLLSYHHYIPDASMDTGIKSSMEGPTHTDEASMPTEPESMTNTTTTLKRKVCTKTCVTKLTAANIVLSPSEEDIPARKKPRLQASLPAIVAADADTLNASPDDDGGARLTETSLAMDNGSLKPAVDDDQPLTLTSTEASSQGREPTETPGYFDVLLGRGRTHLRHPGNERMRTVANMHSMRYNATNLRKEKTAITQEIVEIIQSSGDPPGRFLGFDHAADGWVKVGDEVARRKVSHAIRYDSRYKKRKAKQESFEASVQEASTHRSDALRQGTPRSGNHRERSGDRNPLVSDGDILAGLGYFFHSSNDDDDAPVP